MHPTLLRLESLGDLSISSYFGMVAIGFSLAIFLFWRIGGLRGLERDTLFDLGLYMVIFGVLGARLLHVVADGQFMNYVNWCVDPEAVVWEITEAECRSPSLEGRWDAVEEVCRPTDPGARSVFDRCTLWLQFWQGGLAYYGGFLLATLFAFYFIRREKLPLYHVLDMAGWAIPFGLAWGRMGCFLNGCCFGVTNTRESWWAISFPRWSPAWRSHLQDGLIDLHARASLPVHPTQLYESFAALAIAAVGYFFLERRKRFSGQVFLVSCILYATARFLIEILRADQRGSIWVFSTSQLVAIGVVFAVAVAWPRIAKHSKGPNR